MRNAISVVVLMLAAGIFLCGCAEVNQAAYGTGNAAGQVMTVPRSVTQGATDAYVGSSAANPYQR